METILAMDVRMVSINYILNVRMEKYRIFNKLLIDFLFFSKRRELRYPIFDDILY